MSECEICGREILGISCACCKICGCLLTPCACEFNLFTSQGRKDFFKYGESFMHVEIVGAARTDRAPVRKRTNTLKRCLDLLRSLRAVR